MGPWTVWAIAVVLVFAGASFFFSLAETSLFSLNKWHIRQLAERSSKPAASSTKGRTADL
jgi:Mg2+/Co2+ transporter CorB